MQSRQGRIRLLLNADQDRDDAVDFADLWFGHVEPTLGLMPHTQIRRLTLCRGAQIEFDEFYVDRMNRALRTRWTGKTALALGALLRDLKIYGCTLDIRR